MCLNDNRFILSQIDYNYSGYDETECFNVCYGLDKNFLFGCGVSIASILINNPQEKLAFHVFTDYFSTDFREEFEMLAKKYKTRIFIYLINGDTLKILPSTRSWSYAIYFRFIIADYFSDKLDRILYLDADIVCKGSIQELIDFNFDPDDIAAVVAEGDEKWWKRRAEHLSTPGLVDGYFNSGFLLIQPPVWAAQRISSNAIELLNDQEITNKITHFDQDVLNILLTGKIKFIDRKFNTQYSINYELKDITVNPVRNSTVLVHYIGPTKPWHSWGDYPVSSFFYQAKDASPWQNTKLFEPQNTVQSRYAAKHFLKQKKFTQAFLCWGKYYAYKVKAIIK